MNTAQETAAIDEKKVIKKYSSTFAVISFSLIGAYIITYVASNLLSKWINELYLAGQINLPVSTLNALLGYLPMYILCFPLIFLILSRIEKTEIQNNKLSPKQFFIYLSACFPMLFTGSLIGNMLSKLLSHGTSENKLESLLSHLDPVVIIITVIVAPIFEELVFRRCIISRTVRFGEKTAVIFSAFAFGIFHMNLYQFFYAFGIGLILGYIYLRTGKIIYSITMHIIINSLSSILVPFLMEKSQYTEFVNQIAARDFQTALSSERIIWIALYMCYSFLFFGMVCFGTAMIISKRKQLVFRSRPSELKTSQGVALSLFNVGSIVFIIASVFFFITSLFSLKLF